MINSNQIRYYLIAGLLGIGWFPVLLISPMHRHILSLDQSEMKLVTFCFLIFTSLLISIVFRSFIVRSISLKIDCIIAIALPLIGCLIYVSLNNFYDVIFYSGHFRHDHIILYFWGMLWTIIFLPAFLLYSLFCLFMLRRIAKSA